MDPRIPSQKEIRDCLGSTLADAFFELSNPVVRTFVGVTPPLQGPDEHLWHSPSDQLINKNCLKTPVTSSITQATTHRGVLELGEKALRQYDVELERRIRESLFAEMKNFHLLLEAEQRHITKTRIKKIEDECTSRINNLTKDYDKKLEEALDDVITRYNKILQKAVVQTRMNVTLEMMKKMREEVEFIVTDLNADYDRRCSIQRENMIADFNVIIRKERAKMRDTFDEWQRKKLEDLEIAQTKMANEFEEKAVKLIRCERFICDNEKRKIQENFQV
ncbi:uncharacterized protein [Fopius arisanus]|uniref:Uncharacterized protein n=1 Tax=Fopius arisanus TaxID=64838 RepID=A0A9R1TFY0_9HYME|nr:PREDICTED: uncharacterized protein LOC105269681 [Fopius arisanus]